MNRETKDSGIEWIGEIPQTWKVTKLKNYVTICNGKDNMVKIGKIPVYGSGGIFGYTDKYIYDGESVLMGRKGTIDKPRYVTGKFWTVDTSFYTISKHNTVMRYFYHLVSVIDYSKYKSGSTVPSMTQTTLNEIKLPFPSKSEQVKIADFLDRVTVTLDSIIENTKIIIEDYKLLKQSIITEAVTKGLDKDVEMKDSGIEWVGRIPKHWEVVKIKHLFDVINERNENEGAILLSLFTALGVAPRSEMEDKGNKASTVINYKIVKKGDLIVNKLLVWMGAVAFSDYNGVTSPDYDVYRLKRNSNAFKQYYEWYFRFTNFKDDCYKYGRGIMMMRWRTYSSEFKMIDIVNPPYSEQVEIYEYLKLKVREIDALIEKKNRLLLELETYKKSIIYEYVTGKKEVE